MDLESSAAGHSHTKIVHCVSHIESIKNLIHKRFIQMYQKAVSTPGLVQSVFLTPPISCILLSELWT